MLNPHMEISTELNGLRDFIVVKCSALPESFQKAQWALDPVHVVDAEFGNIYIFRYSRIVMMKS